MPVAGSQPVQRSPSRDSDTSSTGVVRSTLREDGPDSPSGGSDGAWLASINPTVYDIIRELQVQRRARQVDFESVYDELQEQRTQINQRFEKTNERFDKVLQELHEQRTQTKQRLPTYRAQIGLYDGLCTEPAEPSEGR
ncbi:hypothetical protein B0A48_18906 [Cryoendolithus antarcticus]|uniref:Biogenesis of lysosome-related organelles complex 1 subunit KXD1 n=1 Tax=Cryoendolithus antarcticus TaxID=1507870 RepID=A0A1V8S7T6_9PEZI|nr:hypothetical protein B0A48_18906 [Cryoendolithus antarcticus]